MAKDVVQDAAEKSKSNDWCPKWKTSGNCLIDCKQQGTEVGPVSYLFVSSLVFSTMPFTLHPSSRSCRYLASTIYPLGKQNDHFVYRSDHEPLNIRISGAWRLGSMVPTKKRERDLQLNGVAALDAEE